MKVDKAINILQV